MLKSKVECPKSNTMFILLLQVLQDYGKSRLRIRAVAMAPITLAWKVFEKSCETSP